MYTYLLLYIAWIIYNREMFWYLNLNLATAVKNGTVTKTPVLSA